MTSAFDPTTVKACVFDVFGTVVDWRGSIVAEGEARWSKRVPGVDWGAFADAWRAQYGPTMNKVRVGNLGWTGLDELHRMILDDIAPQYGLGVLSEEEMHDLNKIWHRLRLADSPKGVSMLKQHRIVATLSTATWLLTNMASSPASTGTPCCRPSCSATTSRTRRSTSAPRACWAWSRAKS